ncbi:AtpZ/AtpI family protein [Pseudonocardia endophytica]|uniref:Putative F0F1-ATPase subunit (Ca2+/Mg2+ transporter) n=1 Tax=Pseudonocardia endophytica TaxID=401976 RepID=A0A4R1HF10_PSEEN|nr:AtpZ/AtpI family protein [Pseudonocardia endophytica]TCK20717.1 putative F0F1-ATPase subunit (Ca2+/Mg2+ transporter) [Pseudonocardia endophytica]
MPDGDGPGLRDLLNMGMTLGLYVAIGLAAGLFADHVLDTTPVFVLVGIALGIVGATVHVYRLLRRFM